MTVRLLARPLFSMKPRASPVGWPTPAAADESHEEPDEGFQLSAYRYETPAAWKHDLIMGATAGFASQVYDVAFKSSLRRHVILANCWREAEPQLSASSFGIAHIEAAIREASAIDGPDEALGAIDRLWERLESACSVAESRARMLLPRVARPELAAVPVGVANALSALARQHKDGLAAPHPACIESATLLIRALLQRCPKATPTAVEAAPLGAVEIEWGDRLKWLIQTPRLPWPGVQVRTYTRTNLSTSRMSVRVHHTAAGVLEEACELLA